VKRIFLCLSLLFLIGCQEKSCNNILYSCDFNNIKYYGEGSFLLEGTFIHDSLKENRYDRLPASYKEIVREPVWDLSNIHLDINRFYPTRQYNCKVGSTQQF